MSIQNNRKPQYFTDTHKRCSSCNEMKLFTAFSKSLRNKHGNFLDHSCKQCMSSYRKLSNPNPSFPKPEQQVTDTHKSCSRCKTMKLFTEFHKDRHNIKGNGLAYWCKDCANSLARLHNNKHKNNSEYKRKKKEGSIRSAYGIDLETYHNKLINQGCKCKICEVHLPMSGHFTHLDHDHQTGNLRDFLCTNCNRGLGHFQDSKEILMAAIEYLHTHTENGTQKVGTSL